MVVDGARGGHAGRAQARGGAAGMVGRVAGDLPVHLTSFVGRQRELRELAVALSDARVVTLTGPGGCGKSRLAVQAAAEALAEFADGVWWVGLASVADPALVGPALARVLGVRPLPGQSEVQAAVSYLGSRRALVGLDNCEHLLDAAAQLVEALAEGCPGVTVLATSREPLGVPGETDWRVPGLSLPADGTGAGELVERSEAVQLFIERAGQVRPGFRVTEDNAAAVVAVCRELDGIPLAIELAAARLRVLSVFQIAERLADRFGLLTAGPRSGDARHRTLRASMDWSHELLSEPEQVLFRRLGVFMGSFSLEAVEQVGADGRTIDRAQVLDLLDGLIDKSLVQAEDHGQVVRFRLLETIRQYALQRLAEAGEVDAVRGRHRDFYLQLAERMEPDILTPRQPEVLDLLDLEAANFAQAIGWAADTEPDVALRLCVALTFWWRLRGFFAEGEAGFDRALRRARTEPSVVRARALWGRACLLTYAGALEVAVCATQDAIAQAEQVGDRSTTARALFLVGVVSLFPDPVGSRPTLERARELAAASGDEFGVMAATVTLAYSYSHVNDHTAARSLVEGVLPLAERLGYQEMIAFYWCGIAWAAVMAADHTEAQEAYERALDAAHAVNDVVIDVIATAGLARIATDAGAPEQALGPLVAARGRALVHGGAFTLPWVDLIMALMYAAEGRLSAARSALEELIGRGGGGIASVLGHAHTSVAETLRLLGDASEAGSAAHRGLELAERLGDRYLGACARLVLGRLAAGRGAWTAAQRLHHEALSVIVEGGYRRELPSALEALAEVAAGLESYAESARILGAATRARRDLMLAPWWHQREEMATLTAHGREVLGEKGFGSAFAEGQMLSLEDVVAYVRRARGERKRPSGGWESLTPTELEVARHAAAGLTNPEIAERMFIGRGTVKTHLSHIYTKLDLKNRLELGAEVARRLATQDG